MPWKDPTNWVPFMLSAGTSAARWNAQRILEALLIAFFTGGVVMYGTQKVLDARMDSFSEDMRELKAQVGEMRRDLYAPKHSKDGFDWHR